MKTGLVFILAAFTLMAVSTSCLKIDQEKVPTKQEEQILLDQYLNQLESTGSDVDSTDLGVYYVTLDEGTGDFPVEGDTLKVGYAGYFMDGLMFDTSMWHDSPDSTFTFVLGDQPMIPGWDDGMKVINKDARVQLIIPSDLAYGSTGAGIIPPYQTLIFIVIMKDIKPSN
jgi:FKBP-type peptidyl-prolyl cis-trans isomerase